MPPLSLLPLTILLLTIGVTTRAQAWSLTAKSAPYGEKGGLSNTKEKDSKWRRSLPTTTRKLCGKIQFLAALGDHSKIVFSEDKKSFQLFDLKTGQITGAFQQSEGASWLGFGGNTIVTRIGFGEDFVLRSLPNFEPEGPWNPPGQSKASGFSFGSRSPNFLCITADKNVHEVSLNSLKPTSKPFFLDEYWEGGGRNQSYAPSRSAVARELHVKPASADLRKVAMGSYLYRKSESGSKRLASQEEPNQSLHQVIISGSGDWLPRHLFRLSHTLNSPPDSPIIVTVDPDRGSHFSVFDAARSRPLFTILTDHYIGNSYSNKEVEPYVYCSALNKLLVTRPDSGEIALIDLDVETLSRAYPVQMSRHLVTVESPDRFSYVPAFTRSDFIQSYQLVRNSSYLEMEPDSGRISVSRDKPEIKQLGTIRFRAILKGGDFVDGAVKVTIPAKD